MDRRDKLEAPRICLSKVHILADLEGFLAFQTFPPGETAKEWTPEEVQQFEHRLEDFKRCGVAPSRHWGIFSLVLPKKTGRQCMSFARKQQYTLFRCERDDLLGMRKLRSDAYEQIFDVMLCPHRVERDFQMNAEHEEREAIDTFAGGSKNKGVLQQLKFAFGHLSIEKVAIIGRLLLRSSE